MANNVEYYNDPKGKRAIAELSDEELLQLFTKTAKNEYDAFKEANTTIVKAEPIYEARLELEIKASALQTEYESKVEEANRLYSKQLRLAETKKALKAEAERRSLVVKYPDELWSNSKWGSYFENERKTGTIKQEIPPSVSLAPVDDSVID